MKRKIIIIGAGIGGLSTGCYGQMNGYETEIFEMHNISGGLCTSWKRKGYNIDGSIGFLTGTSSNMNFYRVWDELGAMTNTTFVHHDEIIRINKRGKEFILYSDIDKLENHMMETAPEDEKMIREFAGDVRKLISFDPPIDKFTFGEKLKMIRGVMPYISVLGKYRMSIKDFAEKFKNPLLREAFMCMYIPEFPASFALMSVVNQHKKNGGFPVGGSLEHAKRVENRYLGLGGRINFNSKVNKILLESNKAIGIELSDGSRHYADIVVSACDGHSAIYNMLEGKYISDKIKKTYENNSLMYPTTRVYLGVNEDLGSLPHHQIFELEEPVNIAGEERSHLSVSHYCYDKTLAAEGKSIVNIGFSTNYDYWKSLYSNRELYKKEKKVVSDRAIDELDKRYPGIKDKIEMIDVTTPVTYERYTNTWQGSYMGWMPTPETMSLKLPKTLPGLSNFYMAGQWLESLGGLINAALSGRDVLKLITKNDRKKFVTSKP